MKLIISQSIKTLNDYCAELLAKFIGENNEAKIGLATGNTPVGIYRSLVSLYQSGGVDFTDVRTFNLDEYLELPKSHQSSFYSFMRIHLFDHVNLKEEHIFIPDGEAVSPEQECIRYNQILNQAGQLDVQVLGVGLNGHIGFNEPSKKLSPHTHIVRLTEETRRVNSPAFSSINEVPTYAITMGVASILRANWILFMALGEEKAMIMKQALEGPISTGCPASLLQLHPNCTIFLDQKAATELDFNKPFYEVEYI
ncbi:glucosamine-6-phosphate deaminase [Bacillus sp. 1P10SD]|uniref:glucosamine-6-phosphate deaminase n=1 Tax=Bacillus sp. 1P10SD TaxID=3132265 RepID=UPI0039A4A133